jgi:hypothetical protein
MISGAEIASWLLQTAIAAGVATTAFFVLLPTKGMLKNNLVTFLGASFSELWCSSIRHESHEETC